MRLGEYNRVTKKDIYDYLEEVDERDRHCPKCSSTYVKFGVHSAKVRGFEVSVYCEDCGHSDSGMMSDAKRIVKEWHSQ